MTKDLEFLLKKMEKEHNFKPLKSLIDSNHLKIEEIKEELYQYGNSTWIGELAILYPECIDEELCNHLDVETNIFTFVNVYEILLNLNTEETDYLLNLLVDKAIKINDYVLIEEILYRSKGTNKPYMERLCDTFLNLARVKEVVRFVYAMINLYYYEVPKSYAKKIAYYLYENDYQKNMDLIDIDGIEDVVDFVEEETKDINKVYGELQKNDSNALKKHQGKLRALLLGFKTNK